MPTSPDLSGHMLGQYLLRALLGEGGMGSVYRAYQANLRREVAIKILPRSLAEQAGYAERFSREAAISASLEHRHIVPVYDYGTQDDITYVVMRLLTGGSLAARVKAYHEQKRPLPTLAEIASFLKDMASALDYAHNKGVIHRDIKPGNVMFDEQGDPFLVDFGIAKLLGATQVLTVEGSTIGTPAYMAPEQWRAEEPSAATDQYAVGVMVYELVVGRTPFDAPTPYGLMHKHLNEAPPPPSFYGSNVPEALVHVLGRVLAKERAARFETVTAFGQAFERAVVGVGDRAAAVFAPAAEATVDEATAKVAEESPPPETEGISARPSTRKRALAGLAVMVIAVLGLIGFIVLSGGEDGEQERDGQVNLQQTATDMATQRPTATAAPAATNTPDPIAVAYARAESRVMRNEDWTPFEQDFGGVTMVLVPAGCFMMGSNDGYSDEQPVHEQCFDAPFWIDKYGVTNAQFAAFGGRAAREYYLVRGTRFLCLAGSAIAHRTRMGICGTGARQSGLSLGQ